MCCRVFEGIIHQRKIVLAFDWPPDPASKNARIQIRYWDSPPAQRFTISPDENLCHANPRIGLTATNASGNGRQCGHNRQRENMHNNAQTHLRFHRNDVLHQFINTSGLQA